VTAHIAGGVPPLAHMMLWSTNPAGPRWLLEQGADPNLAWGAEEEAPLHVTARRWDVDARGDAWQPGQCHQARGVRRERRAVPGRAVIGSQDGELLLPGGALRGGLGGRPAYSSTPPQWGQDGCSRFALARAFSSRWLAKPPARIPAGSANKPTPRIWTIPPATRPRGVTG